MTLKEYEHMKQVCDFVFSSPPNSEERERRLAQISKADNEKLWDFYSGICSGRIKNQNPQKKESEEGNMTYQEWKAAVARSSWRNQMEVSNFERKNPATTQAYKRRLEEEKEKRSEILAIQDTRARHKAIHENIALFGR